MKFILKAILTVALTFPIARWIYGAGWYYDPIQHPTGFKLYVTIRHTFGAIGSEDADDLMICFTFIVALIISTLLGWVIPV